MPRFDEYADDYEAALGQGLAATGEDSAYFARARVHWLARCLDRLGLSPRVVLDFGCGTGGSIAPLLELGPGVRVIGVDPSPDSLAVAAARHQGPGVSFQLLAEVAPAEVGAQDVPPGQVAVQDGTIDLVFTNGVLHHIQPEHRSAAIRRIAQLLRPGGLLCIWENNLLNPGTRLVMSRIPFDHDAIPLSARQTRRLLTGAGLQPLSTHYLFIFPHPLRALRPIEPALSRLPLGGQYQVLAQAR